MTTPVPVKPRKPWTPTRFIVLTISALALALAVGALASGCSDAAVARAATEIQASATAHMEADGVDTSAVSAEVAQGYMVAAAKEWVAKQGGSPPEPWWSKPLEVATILLGGNGLLSLLTRRGAANLAVLKSPATSWTETAQAALALITPAASPPTARAVAAASTEGIKP